jgi:hypothetical protein
MLYHTFTISSEVKGEPGIKSRCLKAIQVTRGGPFVSWANTGTFFLLAKNLTEVRFHYAPVAVEEVLHA